MKFTCNREELDRQLQYVSRVVTVRSTLPVLSNLLIETDGNIVRLSATDLELAVATQLNATVEQEGSFTVPAKLFQEFIHQNPDVEVSFHLQSNELLCTSDQVNARIPGIEAEEYPSLPTIQEKSRLTLGAQRFVDALKQVVIACAQDQGRPVLTGVYCHLDGESVTLAATDSFRLSERKLPGVVVNEGVTILIPHRTIQELIKICGQQASVEDIVLSLSEQQVVFHVGNVELFSRLLTGNFPKYQAIIPQTFITEVRLATSELTQALRLSSIFASSGVSNVILEVVEDGHLTIASHGTRSGAATHTLPISAEGVLGSIKAAFNARFLLDALGALSSSEVVLKFSGQTSPLVISSGEPDYTQIVMPIRLDA